MRALLIDGPAEGRTYVIRPGMARIVIPLEPPLAAFLNPRALVLETANYDRRWDLEAQPADTIALYSFSRTDRTAP